MTKLGIVYRLSDKAHNGYDGRRSNERRQKDYAQHFSLLHRNLRPVHTLLTTLATLFSGSGQEKPDAQSQHCERYDGSNINPELFGDLDVVRRLIIDEKVHAIKRLSVQQVSTPDTELVGWVAGILTAMKAAGRYIKVTNVMTRTVVLSSTVSRVRLYRWWFNSADSS
jgi:hypothetical protein